MNGILPEKIRNRNDKVGFETPADEWFRQRNFKEYIYDIIKSTTFSSRNLFDVSKVEKLYQRHLNSEINIGNEIWKWLNVELWYREFIDAPTRWGR